MARPAEIVLRPAGAEEAALLSELCMRSKALWGYDAAFLERCRQQLTLTPDYIRRHTVRVAQEAGVAVGVYALADEGEFVDLDFMFVEPGRTRGGVGRLMWQDLMARLHGFGRPRLKIVSDPSAVGFYKRMGAVPCGEEPNALIPGRMLPVLEVRL